MRISRDWILEQQVTHLNQRANYAKSRLDHALTADDLVRARKWANEFEDLCERIKLQEIELARVK